MDCVCWRRPSKCPMVVASKDGGYFRRAWRESPGRGGKNCFVMAVSNVDRDGDHRAAWWNATMSAGVFRLVGCVAALAVAMGPVMWKPCGITHNPAFVLARSI